MRYQLILALVACLFSGMSAQALQIKNEQVILDKLDDYPLCQKKDYSGDWCLDAIRRWVDEHPGDAFAAGKMVRQTMNAYVALPFFEKAFSAKQGRCADEDVQLAVVAGLNLPLSEKSAIETAKQLGFKTCFEELKNPILQAAKLDSYAFKNACHEMIEKKLLTGLKAKKCQ